MTEEVGGASPRRSRGEPGARPLTLITLAGEELPLEVDPTGHASLRSFEKTLLEHRPAPTCFSFMNSGPLLVTSFRFTRFT